MRAILLRGVGAAGMLSALLGIPALQCQAAGVRKGPDQELRDVERTLEDAIRRRDTTSVGRLLTPDFMLTTSEGDVLTRADWLYSLAASTQQHEITTRDDRRTRLYEGTAIVTSHAVARNTARGVTREMELRLLRVYVRREGRWYLATQQVTRIGAQLGKLVKPD